MAELEFLGHTYTVEDYDTVLGTLLKNGHAVPNACRGGHCHSCLMKAEEGVPMPFSQMGLAPELVNEGYFLACQCMIYADIKVTTPEREKRTRFTAMVDDKTALSDQLIRLRLRPARDFAYRAGQYLTLTNIDGHCADYPIASVHGVDRFMEFHIGTQSDEPLDRYIVQQLEENDALAVQTAFAHHHYRSEDSNDDLLLIARDYDLAGALGLLREALHHEHKGEIHLIHLCDLMAAPHLERTLSELCVDSPTITGESLSGEHTKALSARLQAMDNRNHVRCFFWTNNDPEDSGVQKIIEGFLDGQQLFVMTP
jgi:NAD(P)H-flavin reductase/ferredoxin